MCLGARGISLSVWILWGFSQSLIFNTKSNFILHSPFTGVAFLLMDAKECIMSAEEMYLAKIEKFINIHQNSFLVLSAALHGPEEWKLMFRIQQRYGRRAPQTEFFKL